MAVRRRFAQTTFETIPIAELLERLKQQRTPSRHGGKVGETHRRHNAEKPSSARKHILSLSYDLALLESRRLLLEGHGYQVTSVVGLEVALEACKHTAFDLIILGHSIPAAHKRRMLEQVRAVCQTPVLQLQRSGESVTGPDYAFNPIEGPWPFLARVQQILGDA